MPIFEYHCPDCGHDCEVFVRSGSQTVDCPQCQGRRLQKLMSAPAGHVSGTRSLPLMQGCPPPAAGPCSPTCCRLPHGHD